MKELILKYLNNTYKMTLDSYNVGMIVNIREDQCLTQVDLIVELVDIFYTGETPTGIHTITVKWWDEQEMPWIRREFKTYG